MTRKNGGVEETCQHMEYVKMITRRMAIDGEWFTVQFFKEDDGGIRVEVVHDIKNKFYKMYPDNKIIFEES
jgi:regulator of RNase E activity RraA